MPFTPNYEKIWDYVQGVVPLTLRLFIPSTDSWGTIADTNLFSGIQAFSPGVSKSISAAPMGEGEIPSVDKVWHLRGSQLPSGIDIPLNSRLQESNGTIWQINRVQSQTFGVRIRCECTRIGK